MHNGPFTIRGLLFVCLLLGFHIFAFDFGVCVIIKPTLSGITPGASLAVSHQLSFK